ncbi:MAG: flagellar basal body P-ring formation chaperone FlgA [Asticcacaulis sp.]|uniref:flagellar basal body P-ring formation chaperone FlgA n=1 Tax=Asticcacaulis sp. TaxID=1872648 RepID=UPI003F7C754B
MKSTLLAAALLLIPAAACAQGTAALRAVTTDADGRITLGDLFVNAGAAANVQVGTRSGPSAVLDAAIVQSLAARAGLYWDNPRGLRRIIVTQGPDGDGSAPQSANIASAPTPIGWPAYAAASGPVIVKRDDMVAVTWRSGGLSLTLNGQAQKDAALGEQIEIMNPSSKQMIAAVITGPGTAVAGPAADRYRSQMLLSSR